MVNVTCSDGFIAHYQVKGAKHGVRRYQNPDGSLTPLGREHYGVGEPRKSADAAKPLLKNRANQKSNGGASLKKRSKQKVTVSELTDDQLRSRVERLRLEKSYKDLVTPPKNVNAPSLKNTMLKVTETLSTELGKTLINVVPTLLEGGLKMLEIMLASKEEGHNPKQSDREQKEKQKEKPQEKAKEKAKARSKETSKGTRVDAWIVSDDEYFRPSESAQPKYSLPAGRRRKKR